MKGKPSILLLDTNVWLDNYLGYRRHSAESRELIIRSSEAGITLSYAATSIKDVFYCINSELKRLIRQQKGDVSESDAQACNETAWSCIQSMSALAVAATVAEPQVSLARHYRGFNQDFEDDLILAAMECSKADYLVTNDGLLQRKCPFPTLTPKDMLSLLNN